MNKNVYAIVYKLDGNTPFQVLYFIRMSFQYDSDWPSDMHLSMICFQKVQSSVQSFSNLKC